MRTIEILCLSGGGARTVSYVGVFKKLEELKESKKINIDIKEISGVSAGSIFGLGYIIGLSADDFKSELLLKDFDSLRDFRYSKMFSSYGFETGKNMISWIESILEKKDYKKDITFKELHDKTNIKFNVLATNLNKCNSTIFNHINTPDVKVSKAIRLSISIPFYFCVERYNNDLHIDGAVIDNYPIKLYKDDLSKVLGIKIVNHGEYPYHTIDKTINSFDSYIYNVIYCFVINKEKETTINECYKPYTVYLQINNKRSNFMLTNDEKEEFINIGYTYCEKYFCDQHSISL